jgi:non-specific serine/threonine protein kinase
VAADLLEQHPDGVWLVEFTPLADPALVPNSVAAALDIPEQPNRPMTETLANYLRTKNMLLLIDGCEHLHVACQRLIDHLLRASASVRILATSRETLGVEAS